MTLVFDNLNVIQINCQKDLAKLTFINTKRTYLEKLTEEFL